MIATFAICLLFGALAGFLAGLLGIGGGLVLVPLLVALFDLQGFSATYSMIMAVATSLATIIITSMASIWAHQRLGAVLWNLVRRLVPGVFAGGMLGAVIADYLPAAALRSIFAVFMFYVGLKMALPFNPDSHRFKAETVPLTAVGTIIGTLSAILGIGGGTLTVPLLIKLNYPMRNAVAVSSACGMPIALAGTISYAMLGWHKTGLPAGSLGYLYLPAFFGIIASSIIFAPIGAKLANELPTRQLKRYFALLLLIVAIKLLWL
ncbi:MAG: sulfite exporter TauE/SafE family protein [Gammaproteobacteria bacterium]